MSVTASQVFDFIDRQEICTLDRCEIGAAEFGNLRRAMRKIVLVFREAEDQDARDIADMLRALLSEWLTVPVPFDAQVLHSIKTAMGTLSMVGARWGPEIQGLYAGALISAERLQQTENPIRARLRERIKELKEDGKSFKIYCHRRSKQHFDSLFANAGETFFSDDVFLHTASDYRQAAPFEVLIKVGPLRSRGWGAAPDALISAPRFRLLSQIVWAGSGNEADFGYDPATSSANAIERPDADAVFDLNAYRGPSRWESTTSAYGEAQDLRRDVEIEADELREFSKALRTDEKRNAVLVEIDEDHGILYPPHSQVLSFDPSANDAEQVGLRTLGDRLKVGMFLVRALIADPDLGGVQAEHGYFSKIWKARLEEERTTDLAALTVGLRDAGLNLLNIESAVRHWVRPATTVIHAPQQFRHFEILLDVLNIAHDGKASFLARAWNEIRRSRGEAISAGFHEHGIVEQQLVISLTSIRAQIQEKAMEGKPEFKLDIPEQFGVHGLFAFHKVSGIEPGYYAPQGELKVLRELSLTDQWRD